MVPKLGRSLLLLVLAGCGGEEFGQAGTGGSAGGAATGGVGATGGQAGSSASGGSSTGGSNTGGTGASSTGGTGASSTGGTGASSTGGTGASSTGGTGAGGSGGGCNADTTTDPKNCGECGHDCLGATCTNGMCAPTLLYNSATQPVGVAVDGSTVYWGNINTSDVLSAPKAGGGVVSKIIAESSAVYYVAVANGELFWTGASNAIKKKLLPAGATTALEPGLGQPLGVAASGTKAWVAEASDGALAVIDTVNGGQTGSITLQTGSYPEGVATDGTTLYVAYNSGGKIVSIPVSGGTPKDFATNEPMPAGVAVDAQHVYWSTQGAAQTLRKKPKSGGAVVVLTTGLSSPTGVAVDGQYVYCAEAGGGRIFRVPK